MTNLPNYFTYLRVGFESGLTKASESTAKFYQVANRNGNGRFAASCDGNKLILIDIVSGNTLKTSQITKIRRDDRYIRVETHNSVINLWVYDEKL